ncbi:yip1 domain-containing 1 [Dermatophagoides farinae]|uniref:Yipf5-like protein n=1 Tax=Dermatophagoides farinae TaxID=6954 RepID=A0A9D4P7G5_DERFA|nr:protein YIPF5-like [Dermatophagoides farinae]KAH7645222.1 yipf5-like protein [Dermatophagoides farinae]
MMNPNLSKNRGNNDDFWSQSPPSMQPPPSYDFGQFNYSSDFDSTTNMQNQYFNPAADQMNTFTPNYDYGIGTSADPFADEPPLLEELGINFEHIVQKTVAVLNPFRQTDPSILMDADLAGPLVFGLAFGSFLLLSGKIHFSYIYGFGVLGCVLIYTLLMLMSPPNITMTAVCTVSILGYCLLPMVFLSALSIFVGLQTLLGNIITIMVILWCSLSASKLFVTALTMSNQQALVAYPCILFYGVFALLTLF